MRFLKPLWFSLLLLSSASFAQQLDFWAFGAASDPENELIQSWVDDWNASHDQQVKLSLFPASDYIAGPVLPTAFASGTGPDLFLISPGLFMQYAESGIAADLSDVFTPEFSEDLFPAALEAVTVGGVPYSIPFEQEPVALYFNPKLFSEAGVEVPKTWDDLLSVSETFKEMGITPIVIEPSPGPYQNFTWYPFLWSTGADVANEDLTEATFDSPGTAEALDLWRTLIQEGYAPRTTSNTTADITSTPFVTGDAAMWVGGIWAIAPLVDEYPDLEFDIDPLPAPQGKESASVYGGWTMMVNSRSESVEAAKEFASWMWVDGTERPLEWATTEGVFSPRQSVMDAGSDFFSRDHYSTFRDEIQPIARAEPAFPADMVKIISDAIQAAMFRNTSGEAAAGQAQDRLEDYLRSR